MLRDMVRSFADTELAPNAGAWDKKFCPPPPPPSTYTGGDLWFWLPHRWDQPRLSIVDSIGRISKPQPPPSLLLDPTPYRARFKLVAMAGTSSPRMLSSRWERWA